MSVRERAQGVVSGAAGQRLGGERPGPLRAAAGAVIAGGFTGVLVYRLLRHGEDAE